MNLKETKKLITKIKETKIISESEILKLKHSYQKAIFEQNEEYLEYFRSLRLFNKNIDLTQEQKNKGYQYFKKKYFTFYGHLRHNKQIKFSKETLQNLEELRFNNFDFRFSGFVIISTGIMDFIEPIYKMRIKNKILVYFNHNYIDYEMSYEIGSALKDNYREFIKDFI